MSNQVTLTFGGDADALVKASARSKKALDDVGTAATGAGADMEKSSKRSGDLTTKVGHLGSAADGASTALGDAAGAVQGFADMESAAERRAHDHARALNDLKQAQADVNQALIDGSQAVLDIDQANIDAEQATLDAKTAQEDYNTAVREHGVNSNEAKQASVDLKQAQADLKQANQDVKQATNDSTQAVIDAESAQLDANEAMKAANPPDMQKFANTLADLTPILQGVVGVVALVTAAQWAWNVAMAANPIGLIIVAIVAVIAVIVLIATKTTWFQDLWRVTWGWIKKTAVSVWDWLKTLPEKIGTTFSKIKNFITAPFRAAFNFISDAWNNTVGQLQWNVPSWVPGIGGQTVGAPQLPKFHNGGVVPGAPGSEMVAVLQAGETVTPAGRSNQAVLRIDASDSDTSQFLLRMLRSSIKGQGGNVQVVLGR